MTHTIAIVGSGPGGFYAAEHLLKTRPGLKVDLFDRLPTPYGLVRIGVAPDHQGTKNVWRVFQRTAKRLNLDFTLRPRGRPRKNPDAPKPAKAKSQPKRPRRKPPKK